MPPSTFDDPFQPPSAPTGPAAPKGATKNKAFLLIFLGLLWLGLGGLAVSWIIKLSGLDQDPDGGPAIFAMISIYFLILVGLFFSGTGTWARAKGYHPIIGVMLACFGPMGLLGLAVLPDYSRKPIELG